MSENNKNINSSDFKKYFSDKFDSDQKIAFESSMEKDSFESEALEGFNSLENNASVEKEITDIERKISKRTGITFGKTKSISIWKPLSIAASLVIVFGSIFYLSSIFKNDDKFADNKTLITEENIERKESENTSLNDVFIEEEFDTEDFKEAEDPIEEIDITPDVSEPILNKNTKSNKPLALTPDIHQLEDNYVEEQVASSKKSMTPKTEQEAIASYPNKVPVYEHEAYFSESAKGTTSKDSEIDGASDFQKGKMNYQSKNFSEAIGQFQKSLSENYNVIESEYYIAMSYYNLHKYTKAIKSFDKVIGSNSSLSYNAQWYKAIALLEEGYNAESKAILLELSKGNSGFKNQALDKLNSID